MHQLARGCVDSTEGKQAFPAIGDGVPLLRGKRKRVGAVWGTCEPEQPCDDQAFGVA